MKHLILTGDESPDDLREAISNLRGRQLKAVIPSTAKELGDDIDELFDILAERHVKTVG